MSFRSKAVTRSFAVFATFAVITLLAACSTSPHPLDGYEQLEPSTMMDAPLPDTNRQASYDSQAVNHGKYLVELLSCGSCHTDGALIGEPVAGRSLAGSRVGIAYSNPMEDRNPGVVYPANLTPDMETGIGSWTDWQIKQVIRTGIDKHGRPHLPVMPYPAYARISEEDADAIVAYLRSLAPVRHLVPDNVNPGQKAPSRFVHFGVYQSRDQ